MNTKDLIKVFRQADASLSQVTIKTKSECSFYISSENIKPINRAVVDLSHLILTNLKVSAFCANHNFPTAMKKYMSEIVANIFHSIEDDANEEYFVVKPYFSVDEGEGSLWGYLADRIELELE